MPAVAFQLALDVLGDTSGEPADFVLRGVLRKAHGLRPNEAAAATRATFAYYRWRGWLDSRRPLLGQLRHALELDDAFTARPESFSDEKLIERCVPAWTRDHVQVSGAWVRTLQREPRLWLRARRGQGTSLARRLGAVTDGPVPDALVYRGQEDLFRAPEFHTGEFEIQDLTSQFVSLLCAPQPGETWWDACAGEGGKTLHFSDLMQNRGLIWASDRADWRLRRLKLRAARARCFNYRAVPWDGGVRPPTKTRFDGVLVDAPCSGVGTWQRNPHARWTATVQDVLELAAVQKNLLRHAAPSVKPGGRLIYAVCTLTRAETTEVAAAFTGAMPDFEPLALADPLGKASAAQLWYWPQDCGGNGMFVAAWRRRAAT